MIRTILRDIRWGALPGTDWLTRLFDSLVLNARVRFSGDLLLFRKVLLTIEGVLCDLLETDTRHARQVLDAAVLAEFLQHWLAEWPTRIAASLNARSPATHISISDLLSLFAGIPLTWARWCKETNLELLQLFPCG